MVKAIILAVFWEWLGLMLPIHCYTGGVALPGSSPLGRGSLIMLPALGGP